MHKANWKDIGRFHAVHARGTLYPTLILTKHAQDPKLVHVTTKTCRHNYTVTTCAQYGLVTLFLTQSSIRQHSLSICLPLCAKLPVRLRSSPSLTLSSSTMASVRRTWRQSPSPSPATLTTCIKTQQPQPVLCSLQTHTPYHPSFFC